MSMKIITGIGNIPSIFEVLLDVGALTKIEPQSDGTTIRGYITDTVFLSSGSAAAGVVGGAYIDLWNESPNIYEPLYRTHSDSYADQTFRWKIIVFDTGYLFGISKYNYVNYQTQYPPLCYFIGKTVDEHGVEGRGVFACSKESNTYYMMNDNTSWFTVDSRTLTANTSTYITKLTPVYATQSRDRFVDIFIVNQAPTINERHFCLNDEHFYTDYAGRVAIRFDGSEFE